ncbi:MAG: hypothetical protein ABH881_03965 [bacterium]
MDAVAFKIVFGLAILVFCAIIIGIFLLFIKFLLLFNPDITIMGLKMMLADQLLY